MRWGALVLLAVMVGACGEDPTAVSGYSVTVLAESEPGQRLAGVTVALAGSPLGKTGDNGLLQATVNAKEGAVLEVSYTCPDGYRASTDSKSTLVLRRFSSVDKESGAGLQKRVRCLPELRRYALVVIADRVGGLPVMLEDKSLGITGEHGVLHHVGEAKPGTSLSIRIDTSSRPDIKPQNPTFHFDVVDSTEIYTFKKSFEVEKKRLRRKPGKRKIKKIRRIN